MDRKEAIDLVGRTRKEPCTMSLDIKTDRYEIKFDAEPSKSYYLPTYLLINYIKYWDSILNSPFVKKT
jgi:hypothetical protein